MIVLSQKRRQPVLAGIIPLPLCSSTTIPATALYFATSSLLPLCCAHPHRHEWNARNNERIYTPHTTKAYPYTYETSPFPDPLPEYFTPESPSPVPSSLSPSSSPAGFVKSCNSLSALAWMTSVALLKASLWGGSWFSLSSSSSSGVAKTSVTWTRRGGGGRGQRITEMA